MSEPSLKKTLGPLALWGLGVGYVISGEYFGWNLGLPLGGTYGMLAATLLVTVLYVSFVFSYAELSCALPRAGGAYVYAERALGPLAARVAGMAQAIEFVFAPPAIAMAIGAYLVQRFPGVSVEWLALLSYGVFTAINALGVKQAAAFELLVSVLAVAELLLFSAVTLPAFDLASFQADPWPGGLAGMFACLPFALWFYLGIEGVANAAEEARDPQRDVPFGFGAAIATLVALALLVFFSTVGVAGWKAAVFAEGQTVPSDAPLPLALSRVVGANSLLYSLLLGVGLLGLVASFHGILLAAGRATLELGRAGYGPRFLAAIHRGSGTPRAALLTNMALGVIAILSGKTADIITLSCFGAVSMYAVSMWALLRLRAREPELERPYETPLYPLLPWLALALSLLCLLALIVYNLRIFAVFVIVMAALLLLTRRRRSTPVT